MIASHLPTFLIPTVCTYIRTYIHTYVHTYIQMVRTYLRIMPHLLHDICQLPMPSATSIQLRTYMLAIIISKVYSTTFLIDSTHICSANTRYIYGISYIQAHTISMKY